MALRISRRSTDCGRPPGLGWGIRGWTSFHWASARSVGYFARLIPFSTPKTRGEVHFSHRLLGLRRNNHHNDGDNARISSPGGATVHSQGREPLGRAEPNIPKAGAPEVRQQPLTPINPTDSVRRTRSRAVAETR